MKMFLALLLTAAGAVECRANPYRRMARHSYWQMQASHYQMHAAEHQARARSAYGYMAPSMEVRRLYLPPPGYTVQVIEGGVTGW
jgi:hypothetical protein